MPAFRHGPLLPGAAQTQSGGPQAYQGTATLGVGAGVAAGGGLGLQGGGTLGVGAATTDNGLLGLFGAGVLPVGAAATGNGLLGLFASAELASGQTVTANGRVSFFGSSSLAVAAGADASRAGVTAFSGTAELGVSAGASANGKLGLFGTSTLATTSAFERYSAAGSFVSAELATGASTVGSGALSLFGSSAIAVAATVVASRGGAAPQPYALVQQKFGTATTTLDNAIVAGNLVVVMASWGNITDHITGVTDDASGGSNTYSQAGTVQTNGSNESVAIWYCYNAKAATQITIAFSSGTTPQANISEYSGGLTSATVYGGQTGAYASTASFNYGNVTPSESGCLVVAALRTSTSFAVNTRESGWNALTGSTRLDVQYSIQTTATTTDGTTDFAASEVVTGKIAWFRPAESAAATFEGSATLASGAAVVASSLVGFMGTGPLAVNADVQSFRDQPPTFLAAWSVGSNRLHQPGR